MEIQEIESRYMELFWRQKRSQWQNYVGEAHHDLALPSLTRESAGRASQ